MPFFENAQKVRIEGSEILDVKGNYTRDDHSSHITNENSGNTITHNVTDSYNNSTKRRLGNRKTYNTYEDGRKYHAVMPDAVYGEGQPYSPGVGMGFDRTRSASDRRDTIDREPEMGRGRYLLQKDYEPNPESDSESDKGEEPFPRPLQPPPTRSRVPPGRSPLAFHHSTPKISAFKSNNPFAKLISQPESATSSHPHFTSSNQNPENGGNWGPPAPGRYYE